MKRQRFLKVGSLLLVILMLLVGCTPSDNGVNEPLEVEEQEVLEEFEEVPEQTQEEDIGSIPESNTNTNVGDIGTSEIHVLDVGQADSIFLTANGETMLIDAGEASEAEAILNYIKGLGYNKIDYVIGTHPHADHIGGMSKVIDNIDIGSVYLPNKTHTTKTFERMINSIQNKGLGINVPVPGDQIDFGGGVITFLSPSDKDYDNLNNYSISLRFDFGNKSFISTGDAEVALEEEMLGSGLPLKADILKVGHHGSDTSTTDGFLKAVSPDIAVISVGSGNKYNHPTPRVMSRLESKVPNVYRTDEKGTVIFKTDGKNIKTDFDNKTMGVKVSPIKEQTKVAVKEPVQVSEPVKDNQSNTVWITKTGSKYHLESCKHAQKTGQPASLDEAIAKGLEPCGVCRP